MAENVVILFEKLVKKHRRAERTNTVRSSCIMVYNASMCRSMLIQWGRKRFSNYRRKYYVKGQADKVIEILEKAFLNSEEPEIFVISPFTTVANGVKHRLSEYIKNHSESSMCGIVDPEWQSKNIGTVHTFQGKEAKEVVFILGCDTSKEAEGAIEWVSRNIVNVAVTRAKCRLYVIGDDVAWNKSAVLKIVLDRIEKEAVYGDSVD